MCVWGGGGLLGWISLLRGEKKFAKKICSNYNFLRKLNFFVFLFWSCAKDPIAGKKEGPLPWLDVCVCACVTERVRERASN